VCLREVFLILGYEAASLADLGPTFRNSVERKSLQHLKMRPHCLEMPGINHPVRRRHILEERKPQLHRCGNLKKLRMLVWFEGNIWYSGLWPVGFPILYLCDFYYIKVFDTVI